MSSSTAHRNQVAKHHSGSLSRRIRRRTLIWLFTALLLVAAGSALLYARMQGSAAMSDAPAPGVQVHTTQMQPADRFIQSVVTDDGALGWHQLCPNIQALLPMDVLVQQANATRAAVAQEGVRTTADSMGTRPQPGGGAIHLYRLTAHWPNGTTEQRIFSVLTQPSGCVEDVQIT